MTRSERLETLVVRLLRLNRRCDTRTVRWLTTLTVWVGSITALGWAADRSVGLNAPPPIGGDAVSYDALGWELARGGGFSLNLGDPEFLKPYSDVDPATAERLAATTSRGPIASRPPLLPLVMAGLNRVLGRQFWGIRLVNIFALGTVAALLVWTVCRLAGPIPALIGVVQFLIVDPRVRIASREILTEALACLLIALLTMALVRLVERPRLGTAVLAGALFGLAILLRTMFVLWLPVLVLTVWLAPRIRLSAMSGDAARQEPCSPGLARQEPRSSAARPTAQRTIALGALLLAGFIFAATIVFAPWGVRNCRVLGRPMPLGTQGMMELSAGHSAEAFARWGMWHNLEESGFFATVDRPNQTALERELARADYSWQQTTAWWQKHLLQVILLPAMKVFQEFRPHMSGDLYVLAFALLGLAVVRGTPEGRIWNAILLATALGVAVTWSVAGRFVFPTVYVLHCAAAIGVWHSLLTCTLRRSDPATYNHMLTAER